MNIEKAKDRLTEILRQWQDILAIEDETERDIESTAYIEDMPFNEIKAVLLELDKKDKIIELMSEQLAGLAIWNNEKEESLILASKEEVIEHFKAMSEKPTKGE